MGIDLFFSNRTENLLDRLSRMIVLEHRDIENIFTAPLLLVPNANLKKWIQLKVAKKSGIAMNIDFEYLETGLWKLLEILDTRNEKPAMMNLEIRQLLLLKVLSGLKTDEPLYGPFVNYLFAPDGEKRPDYTARLWQLCEKLAYLFQDYEFHRQEMINAWTALKDPFFGMEGCQQQIYMDMKNLQNESFRDSKGQYLSLMEYAGLVMPFHTNPDFEKQKKSDVHIFGFSQVSPFHLGLLQQLSEIFQIHIYALNPCKEFWEDLPTSREKKWMQANKKNINGTGSCDSFEKTIFNPSRNELLELWGKPGREMVELLCRLTGYDFNDDFAIEPDTTATVLSRIQNNILTLSAENADDDRIFQDKSLQIIACPSRYREVETVYNNIIFNLDQNKELRLTDIAILVPEISLYKPVIDAVFARLPESISYNLADARAEIESIFGKAVMGILQLVTGRFSRKEVFELLLNPCVMNKWRISPDDVMVFSRWAESLNIYHAFDQKDKTKRGYTHSDLYTWKQGLVRLTLSRVLSDPADFGILNSLDGFSEAPDFQGKKPYSDFSTNDLELVEKFYVIIETLYRVSGILGGGSGSGKTWKKRLIEVCDTMIEIPSGLKAEKSVREALYRSIEELEVYDRLGNDSSNSSRIDLSFFTEFIKSRLGAIRGCYGDYLTSGVTISALLPMRPIPFSIVYVLGMEEGGFPGKPELSTLDLRQQRKMIGDVNLPERNCYLFLEMLLSVRRKLYISYVCRDLQKDRLLQPASTVSQLRRYVESNILPKEMSFQIVDVPLKGSSAKYLAPWAINDYSDVLVNYSAADRIIYYRENGLLKEAGKRVSGQERRILDNFMPDLSPGGEFPVCSPVKGESITAKKLKRFLENPVRQSIQKHLGLFDDEDTIEDMTISEDEPFYTGFPVDYRLKREPLERWIDWLQIHDPKAEQLDNDRVLRRFCKNSYRDFQMESKTPEEVLGLLDREDILEDVLKRAESLKPILKKMLLNARRVYPSLRIGEYQNFRPGRPVGLPELRLPCVQLTVDLADKTGQKFSCPIEAHAGLLWMWQEEDENWHVLVLIGSGKKAPRYPDKYILEPMLGYLFLRCLEPDMDPIGDAPVTFHMVYKEVVRDFTYRIGRDRARHYLEKLLAQYLDSDFLWWLPFETVVKKLKSPDILIRDLTNGETEKKLYADLLEIYADLDDPLTLLAKPGIPRDVLGRAKKRFGIFFEYVQ